MSAHHGKAFAVGITYAGVEHGTGGGLAHELGISQTEGIANLPFLVKHDAGIGAKLPHT